MLTQVSPAQQDGGQHRVVVHFINNRETPVRLKKGQVLGALGNTYTVNPGLVAATDSTTDYPASPPSSQGKPVDSVAHLAPFDLTRTSAQAY